MSRFVARSGAFLQSPARLLAVAVSTDGVVTNTTISRLLSMHPSIYSDYRALAQRGELGLGDALLYPIQKEITGLGASSHQSCDYLVLMVLMASAKDKLKPTILKNSCQTLAPKLFHLMRYKNLRHIAIYSANLLQHDPLFVSPTATDNSPTQKTLIAQQIWQIFCENLIVSRLTIDIYFDKSIDLSLFADD